MQTVNSFLFYSQCCVCRGLIVPPAVTIREQDRIEIFIRRQIEIPVGSRCCKIHTVDKHLSPEAFLSVVPHKVEDRFFPGKVLQIFFDRIVYASTVISILISMNLYP